MLNSVVQNSTHCYRVLGAVRAQPPIRPCQAPWCYACQCRYTLLARSVRGHSLAPGQGFKAFPLISLNAGSQLIWPDSHCQRRSRNAQDWSGSEHAEIVTVSHCDAHLTCGHPKAASLSQKGHGSPQSIAAVSGAEPCMSTATTMALREPIGCKRKSSGHELDGGAVVCSQAR